MQDTWADPDDRTTWPQETWGPWQTLKLTDTDDEGQFWENDTYCVRVVDVSRESPWAKPMKRLGIQRKDQSAKRDWRDLQAIKNDVCGREAEAVEVFPAESRLVDPSNYTLLWVFPTWRLPIGVNHGRRVVSEMNAGGMPQRGIATP